MRVVFMGTPEFAVPSLRALVAHHDVVAVYSRPDAVSGRGRTLRPSPVTQAAQGLGIEVRQPATLKDPAEADALRALTPDIVVVAAFGMILPADILAIPPLGCINVHASLLPRWRGAAPIQRAILAGDEYAGVAIMRMEPGLDTGPYCASARVPVGDKNATDLGAELAELGANTLIEALDRIGNGTCEWIDQDESLVTYAEKISKADVALDPSLGAEEARSRVRASSAQAPARIALGGRGITILDATPSDMELAQGGAACTKHGLVLGFADGALEVRQVKPDGKGVMLGCDWARGARFDDTTNWKALT